MVEILIGDGQPLVADLLASALTARGYAVVGVSSTTATVLDGVRRHRPHVCLLDHRTLAGPERGRFLVELLAVAGERTRVVVLSVGSATDSATGLRVDGVLDKRADLASMLHGLERVMAGETVTETRAPAADGSEDAVRYRRAAASLTVRERECLALIVDGRTTAQIGTELSISVTTVRSHVGSLLTKLGVHSRLEAAALAKRHELVDEDYYPPRVG